MTKRTTVEPDMTTTEELLEALHRMVSWSHSVAHRVSVPADISKQAWIAIRRAQKESTTAGHRPVRS